jgi:oxalate decarboxylase/phosphoglucose isomerase-like protein (cupin superfamily)
MTDVSDTSASRYLIPEKLDTYALWQKAQNIPVMRGFFVEDLNEVPLEYWDLKGGAASFVVLDGSGGVNDGYVCEIPPGGKLKPQKHLYEEMVYITRGHGSTTVWQKDGRKHSFEWGPGSLFAIPLNAAYQHFNGSGTEAARYFSVTNSCFIINLFHNLDFVFDNDFSFTDRFDPMRDDFFSSGGETVGRLYMTTNFVPDTLNMRLADYSARGKGSSNMKFDLAGNTMCAHISEFQVGTYKKGHRHGPGAHVVILSGQGYSLLWPPDGERRRVDWKPGSVVVPPDQWFHQHFNAGATRARYLALRWNSWKWKFFNLDGEAGGSYTSIKEGGRQIEFEDEDPTIHREFEAVVAEAGAQCQMGAHHPFCTHKPEWGPSSDIGRPSVAKG